MRQDLSSPDSDLLTTEEANAVIELYAKREQERRAEAERLAAMPRLFDVANLVGAAPEDLIKLLDQMRGQSIQGILQEPSADIRMTQEEADELIGRYGQMERLRQEEIERRAQMTSVEDIAESLQIPLDDVNQLLQDVRKKNAPPVVAPPEPPSPSPRFFLEEEEEPGKIDLSEYNLNEVCGPNQDYEYQDSYRESKVDQGAVWALVGVVAVVLLIVLGVVASSKNHSTNYSSYNFPSSYSSPLPSYTPTTNGYAPSRTTESVPYFYTPSTANPNVNSRSMSSYGGLVSPPKGWTIKLISHNGVWKVPSIEKSATADNELESRLSRSFTSLMQLVATSESNNFFDTIPGSQVPWQPSSMNLSHSDIHGYSILESSNGKTTRRCYLPLVNTQSASATLQLEDQKARLEQFVKLKQIPGDIAKWPSIEPLPVGEKILPLGVRITLSARGHVYQLIGKGPSITQANVSRGSDAIRDCLITSVKTAYKGLPEDRWMTTPRGETIIVNSAQNGRTVVSDTGCWIEVYTPARNSNLRLDISKPIDLATLTSPSSQTASQIKQLSNTVARDLASKAPTR